MTTELDERLRAALRAVPREAPPAGLTTCALSRARRSRRRAVTGLVTLVAVLVAAAVTVPTVVLRSAAAPRTAIQPVQPITGFMVTAYTTVADPYDGKIPKVAPEVVSYPPAVYSPSRHRYVTPPWRMALPSPDGRLVAVSNDAPPPGPPGKVPLSTGPVGIVPADRIDDSTAVRWVPGIETYGLYGQRGQFITWASDSRHLVVVNTPGPIGTVQPDPPGTFQLVDAQTLATRPVTLTPDREGGSSSSDPFFPSSLPVVPPDRRGFALTWELDPGPGGISRFRLQYYDDRGERTRHVLIFGTGDLPTQVGQPFSPDGHFAAMSGGDSTDIVDTSSGRVVLHAVDGLFAGWYDADHFIVAGGVSDDQVVRLVELRTGRAVAEKRLTPAKRRLTGAWIAPVRGTPPPGAVVL